MNDFGLNPPTFLRVAMLILEHGSWSECVSLGGGRGSGGLLFWLTLTNCFRLTIANDNEFIYIALFQTQLQIALQEQQISILSG